MQCTRAAARFRGALPAGRACVGRSGVATVAKLTRGAVLSPVPQRMCVAESKAVSWRQPCRPMPYCTASEGEISLAEYTKLIEDSLDSLMESFLDIEDTIEIEDFDCELADGVLRLCLGEHGTYVLNKQAPNKQLWLASPICGPKRYNWDAKQQQWVNTRDGHSLLRLLEEEIKQLVGVELTLSIAPQ